MKHTIEIEGLPEGYNVESVKITHSHVMDGGIMLAVVNVKKKQLRRIVLEETNEENHLYESGQYAAFSAGGFVITGTKINGA